MVTIGMLVTKNRDMAWKPFWAHIQKEFEQTYHRVMFPIRIELSCGNGAMYDSPNDFPTEDTACPCGDREHFLVKVQLVDEEEKHDED